MPQFTTVFRYSESMIRLRLTEAIVVNPLHTDAGAFRLKIQTRSDKVDGFGSPLPRELWIEVIGPAATLKDAMSISAAIANDFARQIAFAANAWHGILNLHLAFDSSGGQFDREFLQNWIRDETGLPRVARILQPDLMERVVTAISNAAQVEKPRLLRAIQQYTDAIQHWRNGQELYALSFLYMGVEAITSTIADREVKRRGLRERSELPKGENEKSSDPWVRREIIFRGNSEIYRLARSASDGLEHGFMSLAVAQEKAVTCLESTASYLRNAVLSLLNLSGDDLQSLTNKPYSTPANTRGYERILTGTISSTNDEIAATDQEYPYVRWEFQLKDFAIDANGGHKMRLTQNLTPFIGLNAKFTPKRIHFASTVETTHTDVEMSVASSAPVPTEGRASGIILGIDDPGTNQWPHVVGSLILNINTLKALAQLRGGHGFPDASVSGNLPVQYSNRRAQIHEETKT